MIHGHGEGSEAGPGELAGKDLAERWDRAERAYDRILTTLWISNAGATLATLAYITANRHDGTFTRSLLVPLVLFVVGLTIPGVSSLMEFEIARRAIMRPGKTQAVIDRAPVIEQRLSEQIKFALNWRTPTALASGSCFTVGFLYGFAMLAQN
jgi:hypothetical protein